MGNAAKRCMVLGLDSTPPRFVFDEYVADMPNLGRFLKEGAWGELLSTIPPITVPAWTCMVTGKNPGWHGCTGFRNRKRGSYEETRLATSKDIREDAVWDILGRAGKRVCTLGVPQTYPVKPVNGVQVSCFLTPDTETSQYTHPPELKDEIRARVPGYVVDVMEFRTEDKRGLLAQLYDKTEKHLALAEMMLERERWDFFMMVEMGPDRIQHALWKHCDPGHRKFVAGNEYESAIRDYYRWLDGKLGRLLRFADDETLVLVVSDHGAKRMDGVLNVNDWLLREGYLKLQAPLAGVTNFKKAGVDWARTTAWGWGGYYARIFLNVIGREPSGVVPPSDYEKVQDEIAARLRAIPDDQGRPMKTRVFKPKEVYSGPRMEDAPDLIVYFGDLYWRAGQDIGHDSIYSFETEIGPDDAVHDELGIFLAKGPGVRPGKRLQGARIYDVASTILAGMGHPVPPGMEGKALDLG